MIIQTFFTSPQSAALSSTVDCTGLDLFFKAKPDISNNLSGTVAPSVSVSLVEVVNDIPRPDSVVGTPVVLTHEAVVVSADATAPTSIFFATPVRLNTNRFYGIKVVMSDPAFEMWENRTGDTVVGSTTISPGSTQSRDGQLFSGPADDLREINGADLKFRVSIARYDTTATTNIEIVNGDLEFLTVSGTTGTYLGGETVFTQIANQAGTVAVSQTSDQLLGTGTTFTNYSADQYLIVKTGAASWLPLQIRSVSNNTVIELYDRPPISNASASFATGAVAKLRSYSPINGTMILDESSAFANAKFESGRVIQGLVSGANTTITTVDVFDIHRFNAHVQVDHGDFTTDLLTYDVAFNNGSADVVDSSFELLPVNTAVRLNTGAGRLVSKSLAVTNGALANGKSFIINAALSTTNPYAAPMISGVTADVEVESIVATSNVLATYANSVVYDSEVYGNGNANTRYISKPMTFSSDYPAEDLRVFLTAHRPVGTDIYVYTRVKHPADSRPLDDMLWTPMQYTGLNKDVFAADVAEQELVEYEFSLPDQPTELAVIPGSYTTSNGSAVITASAGVNPSSSVSVGDYITIRNKLFPSNFMQTQVQAANSTTITLGSPVTNASILGGGQQVSKLLYGKTAVLDPMNNGVAQYLDDNGGAFSGFSLAQVKIILLSTGSKMPWVDELEVVGVSA